MEFSASLLWSPDENGCRSGIFVLPLQNLRLTFVHISAARHSVTSESLKFIKCLSHHKLMQQMSGNVISNTQQLMEY